MFRLKGNNYESILKKAKDFKHQLFKKGPWGNCWISFTSVATLEARKKNVPGYPGVMPGADSCLCVKEINLTLLSGSLLWKVNKHFKIL